MDSLSYKTISANAATVAKEWVVIDATNEVLGRLASQIAKILRGKNMQADAGGRNGSKTVDVER